MTRLLAAFGVCDCHSHIYGPLDRFPLSAVRTFDPPESPIESLEEVWQRHGIDRAVLIQGSAYGSDHKALINAIGRNPELRRGVATVSADISQDELVILHKSGVRAVRFNWIKHLLYGSLLRPEGLAADASRLLERVQPLGWHAEVHIDAEQLELVEGLSIPRGMPLVIDHAARLDATLGNIQPLLGRLLRLLERDSIWVKISGADRLAAHCESLESAAPILRAAIRQAPEKCVWGFDWPHVNLARKRSESELLHLLESVAPDEGTLRAILIDNPARLYGFPVATNEAVSTARQQQGASIS